MRERQPDVAGLAGPALPLDFAGLGCLLDHSGALYLPAEATLVVADLHLEKGSAYAAHGQFLPPFDSEATLLRLSGVIEHYQPQRVIALGDSFHDAAAWQRLSARAMAMLEVLAAPRDWLWISGNHDPAPPQGVAGSCADGVKVGSAWLRHEPEAASVEPQICGHFHPVARLSGRGINVRRRCFAFTSNILILPAFAALTGGLNVRETVLTRWLGEDFCVGIAGHRNLVKAHARACRAGP